MIRRSEGIILQLVSFSVRLFQNYFSCILQTFPVFHGKYLYFR